MLISVAYFIPDRYCLARKNQRLTRNRARIEEFVTVIERKHSSSHRTEAYGTLHGTRWSRIPNGSKTHYTI